MSAPSFNLIDRPWIRVRSLGGHVEERALRDTLATASEIRGLAGEIPTQDAAVLRLLLAVILGATRTAAPRPESAALDLFERWWNRGSLPMEELDPYLDRVRERFDLFDARVPFLQVAGLTTGSGKRTGLGKVISDLPANFPFFTTRGPRESERLDLAEAARWLVHCQAFDPSGIKTGALGDDRVKAGKGYPFGYPAWAGNLGLVIAEGRSLYETLVLNVPWRQSGPRDLPVWERAALGPGPDIDHPTPTGPADLFTWPSRRMRLFFDGDEVIDVQISNGDKLGPQNLHPFEAMSAWRYSKDQSKGGEKVLMPVTHDPTRRVWQGLGSLLQGASTSGEGMRAPVVAWIGDLRQAGILKAGHLLNLRIVGLEYGTQNSVIVGGVDDALTASVAALTHPVLAQAAVDASSQASHGVAAFANLAGNLDRAAGGDGKARERAFEEGYALLDGPFRAWVRSLTEPARVPDYRASWSATASALLARAGDRLVVDAGPAALVGRTVNQLGSDSAVLLDAGLAHIWFRASLAKTFPQSPKQPAKVTS